MRSHLAAAPRNGANRVNLEMRCYHVARVEKEPHSFFLFSTCHKCELEKEKKSDVQKPLQYAGHLTEKMKVKVSFYHFPKDADDARWRTAEIRNLRIGKKVIWTIR